MPIRVVLLAILLMPTMVVSALAQGEPPANDLALVQTPRMSGVVQSAAGEVQSASGERVTLVDGRSFAGTAESRVNRVRVRDLADLQPGQNVGILTQPQPNKTLAVISVHISNPERPFTPGENPIIGASDNVMNNAVIEEIGGRSITFRLPGRLRHSDSSSRHASS